MLTRQPDDPGVRASDLKRRPRPAGLPLVKIMAVQNGAVQWAFFAGALCASVILAGVAWLWQHRAECLLSAATCFGLGFAAAFQI